jgi:hypothetical protein
LNGRVKRITCGCLSILVLGGCSGASSAKLAEASLRSIAAADEVVLYSIDFRPDRYPERTERFHDFPVLGSLRLTEAGVRGTVLAALKNGIARCRLESGYDCFWPRHGIRAERGGKATDYVICFECAQIYVYDGNGTQIDYVLTTGEPQQTLDRLLTADGIPLAPARTGR